jgi:tetratricopeptide (TPR) repeat protein
MEVQYKNYYDAVDWCFELSRQYPRSTTIKMLTERLLTAQDKWEITALKEHLAREYVLDQKTDRARKILEELVLHQSGSEISLAGLASHYLYAEENFDKALETIQEAEKASIKSGNFRRHIQAQKARIALARNDYKLLSSALKKITEISVVPGQRDIRRERDFYDQADKSRLDETIVVTFEKYLKQTS